MKNIDDKQPELNINKNKTKQWGFVQITKLLSLLVNQKDLEA